MRRHLKLSFSLTYFRRPRVACRVTLNPSAVLSEMNPTLEGAREASYLFRYCGKSVMFVSRGESVFSPCDGMHAVIASISFTIISTNVCVGAGSLQCLDVILVKE